MRTFVKPCIRGAAFLGASFLLVFFLLSCASTEKEWQRIKETDDINLYFEFIIQHTGTSQAEEAKQRLEDMSWRQALAKDSIQYYELFLVKHPPSQHRDEAVERRNAHFYEALRSGRNVFLQINRYRTGLDRHQNTLDEYTAEIVATVCSAAGIHVVDERKDGDFVIDIQCRAQSETEKYYGDGEYRDIPTIGVASGTITFLVSETKLTEEFQYKSSGGLGYISKNNIPYNEVDTKKSALKYSIPKTLTGMLLKHRSPAMLLPLLRQKDENTFYRYAAMDALASLDTHPDRDAVIEFSITALFDEEIDLPVKIGEYYHTLGAKAFERLLRETAAKEGDPFNRGMGVLERFDPDWKTIDTFIGGGDGDMRLMTIHYLGRLLDKRSAEVDTEMVVDRLIAALKTGPAEARTIAAYYLSFSPNNKPVPYLIDCLESGDEVLIRYAHYALREITGLNLGPTAQEWNNHLKRNK